MHISWPAFLLLGNNIEEIMLCSDKHMQVMFIVAKQQQQQ